MKTPKNILKGLLLIMAFACIISCTNDATVNSEALKFEKNYRLTMDTGYTISNGNEPVKNVIIKKGNENIATSRDDGSFSLEGIKLRVGDVLSFEHSDYVTVIKVVSEDMRLIVSMKKRAETVQIDTRIANQIKVGKGGKIVIPENTLGYNNQPYEGLVNVQATYIDVTDSFDLRSAPGSYIAQGNKGLYPLTSFGMIEIVVTIPGEEIRLDVVEGSSIQIAFPITSPRDTPNVVNLYAFDVKTGYWIQEGELINTGEVLLGEVTSINSAWNADDPCGEELICVKIKVIFTNGNPGCGVAAEGISYQGFDGIHSIGADDYVSLMVCPDSAFELQSCFPVCIPCPGPVYTTTIDLSTVTTPPGPDGCIDLGTWTIVN